MTPTQSERLLTVLRAANGGAVSERWLIAALWGGKPPCTVYELLRVIVSEARRGAKIVRHRDRAYVAYSLVTP